MPLDPSSGLGAESDLLEFRTRHRKVLVQLRRLQSSAQGQPLGGGRFLVQYDQFVECVSASFAAEERLLKRHRHAAFARVSSTHRGIVSALAATRDSLRTRASIGPWEFLHRLDSLVVYLTVDHATYAQPEGV
jgi:hypothetical protein